MSNPDDCQVIRHTQYEEILVDKTNLTTGEERIRFLGQLEDGSIVCSNLDLVQYYKINLANEFFYLNWTESSEMMEARGFTFVATKMATLESFDKSFDSPKLYIRCLLDDKVFYADMKRVLQLAKPNQGSTAPSEQALVKKPDEYVTIPLDVVLQKLEFMGVDMNRIVIVPDIIQQRTQETSDWELPFETYAPDGTKVMSIQQAIFGTFQMAMFGRGEKCKKKCARDHEKAMIKMMEGYAKSNLSFYIPTKLVLANIATANNKLCKKCKDSRAKTPSTKPYPDNGVYDEVPPFRFHKFGQHTGREMRTSGKNTVWETRQMMFLECIVHKFCNKRDVQSILMKSVDFLAPYKIRSSKERSDSIISWVDRLRSMGLEAIPGMVRRQFNSILEASRASQETVVEEQPNEEGETSEVKDSELDASKEHEDDQMPGPSVELPEPSGPVEQIGNSFQDFSNWLNSSEEAWQLMENSSDPISTGFPEIN